MGAARHATGELVEAATYQAYGAPDSDYRPARWASFRDPQRFSGKEDDIELGLHYSGARYYCAQLGTWLSPDPVTIHEGGSDVNPYAYVGGSPIMAIDPDGREPITIGIVAGVIIISALVAGGTSVGYQWATVGWDRIDWGLKGVGGAMIAGGVAGGVTLGVGAAGGAVLGAGFGATTASGAVAGAAGAGSSYVTGSLVAGEGRHMTWGGFGKAVAIGGAGGLAGGAAGFGAAFATKSSAWGGIAGGVTGSGAGLGTSVLAFGDKVTGTTIALSLGGGLAGALAGAGAQELLRSPTPTVGPRSAQGLKGSGGGPDGYDEQLMARADEIKAAADQSRWESMTAGPGGAARLVQKAWRAAVGLRMGAKTEVSRVLGHLAADEGVYTATQAEAMDAAAAYSRLKGGSGRVKVNPAHLTKDGSAGYPHVHALDAEGSKLPGHFWFGKASTVQSILNGILNFMAPLGVEIQSPEDYCASNPYCT